MDQIKSMETQFATDGNHKRHSENGRSIIETLMVVAIASILTSVTLPQVISTRRLLRSASLPREIAAQLRFARQQAISQRQVFTFQYDDSTKQINIIDHNNRNNTNASCNVTGQAIMADPSYPNTTCAVTVLTVPLGGGSLPTGELSFGVPSGISATLSDTATLTALVSNKINITFQQDGTVIDAFGNPTNRALFLYNNKIPNQTASAVSVLGSAGRIRVWRYDTSASKFAE